MAAYVWGFRVARFFNLAAGVCVAASALAASGAPAEARGWRHYHRVAHAYFAHHRGYAVARRPALVEADAAFSAIVVDANSGRELYGVNENGLRHPASITKVMTLYLLFEQLDKGALTLQSQIPISEHAAAQAPSKLGISAGDSLSVDEAIKAIVTRSANDVAVAIAEAIGGDEFNFAQMMTRKAHALGMSRTIYRNASGLPNDEQITTARDLTVLARATEERFPEIFSLFLDARIRLCRRDHRQSQPPLGSRRRRRWNQDGLHPRLRLQSPDIGASRRAFARGGGHGRTHVGRS